MYFQYTIKRNTYTNHIFLLFLVKKFFIRKKFAWFFLPKGKKYAIIRKQKDFLYLSNV